MKCLAQFLPEFMKAPLFGDRARFGLVADENDADWKEWMGRYNDFYTSTQKGGIGKRVNDAGYAVLRRVSLDGKVVCEIGPGTLPHKDYWNGTPGEYIALDISEDFLNATKARLGDACFLRMEKMTRDSARTSLPDQSVDIVVSFYSLEHLMPLDDYLKEFLRILKPGGLLVGAVPNEGGLAWGLGRFLTSRRWIRKHTTINYDKIICWEHPNTVDTIFERLDALFERQYRSMYPLPFLPLVDLNLITKFMYRKPR